MVNQGLKLIEIEKLLSNFHFFIPSYQRGYRWDIKQVEDLCKDIWDFAKDAKKRDNLSCRSNQLR